MCIVKKESELICPESDGEHIARTLAANERYAACSPVVVFHARSCRLPPKLGSELQRSSSTSDVTDRTPFLTAKSLSCAKPSVRRVDQRRAAAAAAD